MPLEYYNVVVQLEVRMYMIWNSVVSSGRNFGVIGIEVKCRHGHICGYPGRG